jgi:hypothetical protein
MHHSIRFMMKAIVREAKEISLASHAADRSYPTPTPRASRHLRPRQISYPSLAGHPATKKERKKNKKAI